MYKVVVDDSQYKNWTYYTVNNLQPVELDFSPLDYKLYSNDMFDIIDNKPLVIHSLIKESEQTAGVLSLQKTFGRCGKKFYYQCIPNDKRLPHVLIPYSIKNDFHKKNKNLYVLFKYTTWDGKHPNGMLLETLGSVNDLPTYYNYLLYCKNLNISLKKFNEDTNVALKKKKSEQIILDICKQRQIEDRTSRKIFTIDSSSCLDYDDAVGFENNILSVYISNVPLWIDCLQLWRSFTKRVSTIYLPDKKRPMLPTILSDCLCSLQENQPRITFTMDMHMNIDGSINHVSFCNTLIRVCKNHVYESDELLNSYEYKSVFSIVKMLSETRPFIHHISNSYDVISYLAISMNYECSKYLLNEKTGIFRQVIQNEIQHIPKHFPENVKMFFSSFHNSRAQYTIHSDATYQSLMHKNIDSYLHITSPIRRLVDLLNMLQIQIKLGLSSFNSDANDFYTVWINDLDYINKSMRAIRKVQNKCEILDLCDKDESQLTKTHTGYLFDKVHSSGGLYQYNVFLQDIRLVTRISILESYENYSEHTFKLFIFLDESNCKKKIRLQLLN